jgi:hypothetical protein
MTFHRALTAAALATGLALSPLAAAAQTEAPEFQAEQLDAFTEAYVAVSRLQQQYSMELEEAQSEADQQAIVAEANAEMEAAIEAVEGITPEEYLLIARAAAQDPELSDDLVARIQNRTATQ